MALKGLIERREIWVPTWRGCILILLCCVSAFLGFLYGIHPFLATSQSQGQGILIVEGWLSDKDFEMALPILTSQSYHIIITTGGELEEGSIYQKVFPNRSTGADVAAAEIIALGVSKDRMKPVPSPRTLIDRTYSSAVAVKKWLDDSYETPLMIDVLTIGVHARRTWLLFDLVLGNDHRVGVIALRDRHYDEKRWWHSSEGIKTVIKEFIGYLYAKFLFWPE